MSRAEPLVWRKAGPADSPFFFRWRNDPVSRRLSLSSGRITRAAHQAWFAGKLADARCRLWVALDGKDRRVGQVRLDAAGPRAALVSITVAPERRGQGWGTRMLRDIPGPRRPLRAMIKTDNLASVVAFLKAGFRFRRLVRTAGASVYELERTARGE